MDALLAGLMLVTGGLGAPDVDPETRDWAALDKQLERLAESVQEDRAPRLGLLMRGNYANSSDIQVGGNDLGGFLWDNLRVSVDGQAGAFEYRFQTESATAGVLGAVTTLDAWVRTPINTRVRLTMGLFGQPFLNSSGTEPQNLLFILRTASAQFWNSRDQGVMLDGSVGALDWAVAAANGTDAAGDDMAYSGQLTIQALGGGLDQVEGAYGKGDDLRATAVASMHVNENSAGDNNVMAFELAGSFRRGYAALEYLNYPDDGGAGTGVYSVASDTAPLSAVLSFMFVEDKYEAAVRYQDLDDSFETSAITFGVNRYIEGRNLMWQLNYIDKSADAPAIDAQTVAIGFTASL